MVIDDTTKAQVVLAASIVAGAAADEAAVTAEARKIIARLSPGSAILSEFDRAEKRAETTEKVKSFRATVVGVDKEAASTRGVVFLKSRPSEKNPSGREFVRTDRTDTAEGKAVAVAAQGLIGHQVTVHVAMEKFGNDGYSVRVVRGLEDLGVDPAYNAADPEFQVLHDQYKHLNVTKLVSHGATAPTAA